MSKSNNPQPSLQELVNNLEKINQLPAFYFPEMGDSMLKKEMPSVTTILGKEYDFGIDPEELCAIDQMEEAIRWERAEAEKEINSYSEE